MRLFKFDFANLTIATPQAARQFSKEEIIRRNGQALRDALRNFKRKNPEVMFAAFNGFGGETEGTFAPVRQTVDLRWLDAFDSVYCGDPRLSDVPAMNFWRSMDVYSDHMVRYYEANGVPLERIDNTGCMFGVAGTCYGRRTSAWKSMLLLEHARGGWMNVYYGNLELIDDAQARWFAKVQNIFLPLQSFGHTYPFGELPGRGEPYGFCSVGADGSLYTVVNPSQAVRRVKLPRVHVLQPALTGGRIQFQDAGFEPVLTRDSVLLGPEQLVVAGYGEYSKSKYHLGAQDDVVIPRTIQPFPAQFHAVGGNAVLAVVPAPEGRTLRIVMRQLSQGKPVRSSAGAPPLGMSLGKMLRIEASQDGRPVRVQINYDKAIWSGLSWAVGEIAALDLQPGLPLTIRCSSTETARVDLEVDLYLASYN